jgi:hypothetical protein
MNAVRNVRDGAQKGLREKWLRPEWDGHAWLSDGGLVSSFFRESAEDGAVPSGEGSVRPGPALALEAAWIVSGDEPAARAVWRMSGLGELETGYLKRVAATDWSEPLTFLPEPMVASQGVNLPDPGRGISGLPAPLKYLAGQLAGIGIDNDGIRQILTGKATFSVGGRTQLLWFDLPGVAIDIPGRGDAATDLIDKFWSEVFIGAAPQPAAGFDKGGVTDLPFTVTAASSREKAVIGLVKPDAEQCEELRGLLSGAESAAAWFYVNFPKFGDALLEIPALNAMMYECDEPEPLDEESAKKLRSALASLGRIFVTFKNTGEGSAICYY